MASSSKVLPIPTPSTCCRWCNDGEQLRMAYMDVAPAQPNGRTVVLLHGRNFPSSYWAPVIKTLNDAGYRVVVPDQIGFGKSSKPHGDLHFDTLARNTIALLDHLQIAQGRHRRAFARRHARRAHRARLSRPRRASGADRADRAGGLPALRAADADRKDHRERGQAHRRRLSQAARDQLCAETAAGPGDAVHRRALQHQGQRRISALAARLRQVRRR